MQSKLQEKLDEAAALKMAINTLCGVIGVPPMYSDVEAEKTGGGLAGPLRPDIYYGKQLATAVKEYLEYVKQAARPEDIVSALEQGGFDFAAVDWAPANRQRNLSISLSKNTAAFRRLPNGMFGLNSWYEPIVKRKVKKRTTANGEVEVGEENIGPKQLGPASGPKED